MTSDEIDRLSGGDKLRALVDAVVAAQRSLHSMRAEFVQHKESALLLEPIRASGVFFFRAPDAARWDYLRPDPMVVVFADDVLTTYHPDRATAERVETSRRHRRFLRVLAGTQPLDELSTTFAITLSDPGPPSPYRLTLTTTNRLLARRLQSVGLAVDRRLLLPVEVEYLEADGDRTRYEFSRIELNPDLEDTVFHLELGEDVRVETVDASGRSDG
jgi:outer membrane lipoprotein-sorting protein